jgi:hypothetical protein
MREFILFLCFGVCWATISPYVGWGGVGDPLEMVLDRIVRSVGRRPSIQTVT